MVLLKIHYSLKEPSGTCIPITTDKSDSPKKVPYLVRRNVPGRFRNVLMRVKNHFMILKVLELGI